MILNGSRRQEFKDCEQKAEFHDEQRLKAHREDSNLLLGGGLHKALALMNAKAVHSVEEAADAAEAEFKARIGEEWDKLLPEERVLYNSEVKFLRNMVTVYAEYNLNEPYQMVHPEVKFRVELPNSKHHCWYVHRLLYETAKNATMGSASSWMFFQELAKVPRYSGRTADEWVAYYSNHTYAQCSNEEFDLPCFQSHYFTGSTDAVVLWNRLLWLQEHKTTAYDLYSKGPQARNYVNQWQLNDQATGYIYGIWKSTGLRPQGVLLNAIIKPRKNAVTPVFDFYREAFLRTQAILLRFERDVTHTAQRYEDTMRQGSAELNPANCFKYNRTCYYRNLCLQQREPHPGEFLQRPMDYVEAGYYELLGLTAPKEVNTEDVQNVEIA